MGGGMSKQMNDKNFPHDLFQVTMKKKWKQVVAIYKENPSAHETKLTKSEETAFHIAISNYHSRGPSHANYIQEMMDIMEKGGTLNNVLSMKNVRGDTPLHLAAAVGYVAMCERIAKKNRELISIRNAHGETPLFVAANRGKLQIFLCLHEIYNATQAEPDESLCRRQDGNTILHTAIFGEYFELAYQIIIYYPKLINSRNAEGEFPLHVLAQKPNVFKSSRHLGFYDSIIYSCIFVDELKQQKYNRRASQNDYSHIRQVKYYPENCETCAKIFLLLWTPIYKSFEAGFRSCNCGPTDEENQQHKQKEPDQTKDTKGKRKDASFFPANYATCILLFKFAMKVILIVVGVGFWRIKRIYEKKVRHTHAKQIMSKMIEYEPEYRYDDHGQRPFFEPQLLEGMEIPEKTPQADHEHDGNQIIQTDVGATSSNKAQPSNENVKDQNKPAEKVNNNFAKKETPLLVAAKMGIPEMVKKIVNTYPVAIEDQDSEGKNALMLAAENRHTNVYDYLLKTDLPEYVFHQVDKDGNSILHLAAKLGDTKPWHIPGAALQMQWEIKWFEHVKKSTPPMSFAHHNAKGETPRKIFTKTHEGLVKEGNEWLIKTSESCSVVAALIAAVAFATSSTVPGGLNQETGHPILKDHKAFDVFAITSLIALCLAVTALVFFLAIITSRFEERDFKTDLPKKLLMGLTCLFSSIAAMLVSFCAGHTFILREKLKIAAVPIYAVATIPVTFFAIAQLPLYFDLLWAACRKVPLRSYKLFHE